MTASLTLKLALMKCHCYLVVAPAYFPTPVQHTLGMLSRIGVYFLMNLHAVCYRTGHDFKVKYSYFVSSTSLDLRDL